MNMSNINLKGYGQSVRKEIESIHDSYLELGGGSKDLPPQKKERKYLKYFLFLNKLSLKNNKASI